MSRLGGKIDICVCPWYELNISGYNSRVSCCCYYHGPVDRWSNNTSSLNSYWNSMNMVKVRETVSNGVLKGGCLNCSWIDYRDGFASYFPDFLSPSKDLTEEQKANWRLAVTDYKHRTPLTSAFPLRYYLNFGLTCNLSCIMCMQIPLRKTFTTQIKTAPLMSWEPYFTKALDISVIGGEPLVISEAVKFMRWVTNCEDLSSVKLSIFTNGILLHNHLDWLRNKRKVNVCVSLDSIGEAYESIRGGKWSHIERNLMMFKEVGKALDWELTTTNIIMRSSLPRLVEFVKWSAFHTIKPRFIDFISSVGSEKVYERENLFAYPRLLKEIPEWENIFDEAVELLKEKGWADSVYTLKSMKRDLQHRWVSDSRLNYFGKYFKIRAKKYYFKTRRFLKRIK